MKNDELHEMLANICRIGAQPGGNLVLEALFPGTLEAVKKATKPRGDCPICRMPHPGDVPCKPLEAFDNGPRLYRD